MLDRLALRLSVFASERGLYELPDAPRPDAMIGRRSLESTPLIRPLSMRLPGVTDGHPAKARPGEIRLDFPQVLHIPSSEAKPSITP